MKWWCNSFFTHLSCSCGDNWEALVQYMYIFLALVLGWVDNLSTDGVHSAEAFSTDVACVWLVFHVGDQVFLWHQLSTTLSTDITDGGLAVHLFYNANCKLFETN